MTVNNIIENLNLKVFNEADFSKEVENGYAGDFLSNTISKAPDKSVWLTVMNNVNVAAVASLVDCSLVILCEGVTPDEYFLKKACEQKINVAGSDDDVFTACRKINL